MRSWLRFAVILSLTIVALVSAPPASATFPAENGLIAFAADTGEGYELYTVRPNGNDMVQITDLAAADAVNPDWSPDGQQIAFELDRTDGPLFCSVMVMDADGTDMVDLTDAGNTADWTGCEGQPSFTPDGTRLVFVRFDEAGDTETIWSMDLTGGDRTEVTGGSDRGVTDPNVSPDGQVVSFIEFNGTDLGQALSTVPIEGGTPDRITSFHLDVAIKHDWSPTGRRLVFTDNADRDSKPANVATIKPDGTGIRYLTAFKHASHRAYTGGYSPNGKWIVFRIQAGDRYGLFRMHPDGTGKHMIIPMSDFVPRFIDWGAAAE